MGRCRDVVLRLEVEGMRRLVGLLIILILTGCGTVSEPIYTLMGRWEELNSQLETRQVAFSHDFVYYIEAENIFQCWNYVDGTLISFPLGGTPADAANQRWAIKWEGANQVILTSNGEQLILRRTSDNRELSQRGDELLAKARLRFKSMYVCPQQF
jgi:hypothetical protein